MEKNRHSDSQIMKILKDAEAGFFVSLFTRLQSYCSLLG